MTTKEQAIKERALAREIDQLRRISGIVVDELPHVLMKRHWFTWKETLRFSNRQHAEQTAAEFMAAGKGKYKVVSYE